MEKYKIKILKSFDAKSSSYDQYSFVQKEVSERMIQRLKFLKSKDIIMLVSGGHGFKILKDVEMLEIKQGPYNLIKDKIKFENIHDSFIKLKK